MDRSSPTYLVLSVIVTCAVSAAGLSVTYAVTKDRIAEQERAAETKALKAAVSSASEFEALGDDVVKRAEEAAGETPVYAIHRALDRTGAHVGWGVQVGPRGYGGPIRMAVGLDRDGKVLAVSIITANETPGLGSRVLEDDEFLGRFAGVDSEDAVRALKAVDTITGATKSSGGVKKGVLAAGAVYQDVLSKEGSGS